MYIFIYIDIYVYILTDTLRGFFQISFQWFTGNAIPPKKIKPLQTEAFIRFRGFNAQKLFLFVRFSVF